MVETISVMDAKRHFSDLLRRVREGERFIVTRHGHPVAQIGPPDLPSREHREAAIRWMREIGSRNTLQVTSLEELIDEGRR